MTYELDELLYGTLTDEAKIEYFKTLSDKELDALFEEVELPIWGNFTKEEDSLYVLLFDWIEKEKGTDFLYSLNKGSH